MKHMDASDGLGWRPTCSKSSPLSDLSGMDPSHSHKVGTT